VASIAWGPGAACAASNWRIYSSSFLFFSSASSSCSTSNSLHRTSISSLKARSVSRLARSVARLSKDNSFSLRFSSVKVTSLALPSSSCCHFCSLSTAFTCWARWASRVSSRALSLVWYFVVRASLWVTASCLPTTFFSLWVASSSLAHTLWRSFLYSLWCRLSWDRTEVKCRDAVLVRSFSWVLQSLRRWCSASSASHSRKIAASVSLRTWWARDNMRGRGTGAASRSAPDRSRHPNTTSISSGAGGGMELDVPPVSPPVLGVRANPPSGTFSAAATPPDAGATAAGSPVGAWEAGGTILAAAGSGPPTPPSADSCCSEPDPS
jgi:hypothetical protein